MALFGIWISADSETEMGGTKAGSFLCRFGAREWWISTSRKNPGKIFRHRLNLRQGEEKTGALAQLALYPDFAAVRLHDVFDDGEAEAGAARLARARAVHAVKSLEDAVLRLGGNSWAVALDPELNLLTRDR